jgi:hypothetical protein
MGILDQTDWSGVDESQQGDFTPVPEGQYTIEAVSFEERTYNSGNEGIDIQFKIVGPTHENRRVFETFVLTGKNPNVAIGRLKGFARGTGINVDTTQLNTNTLGAAMNRPLQANIGIEGSNNGYPPKNKIKSFLAPDAQPAQQQAAQPQAQPAPQQQAAPAQPAPQAQQPAGQQVNWD